MELDESGYRGLVYSKIRESNIKIGDIIEIQQDGKSYSGTLIPRSQIGSNSDHIVIKIESGYNIGIKLESTCVISRISGRKERRSAHTEDHSHPTDGLPLVAILSTGGTIASKVDYRTGAVNPALSAQDLHDAVPELKNHANVRAKVLLSKLSENLTVRDWTSIAREIASQIRKNVDGVVVAHGTDTLGFTSAALSFALQNLPVPVVLVGSQRSSDRPSSDAAMNLIGATELATRADAAEVMVLMHAEIGDVSLHAHRGTRVRKLHTSRRDAFRSVNSSPLFTLSGTSIVELSSPIMRRNKERRLKMKSKFEDRVALVKTYPGMNAAIIDQLIETEYRGIVLEGTGLGHAPENLQPSIKRASDSGLIVAMTSQCIFGRVNMNVYRSGVELLNLGVIPCEDMIPETAFVKMMWTLANSRSLESAKSLLLTPIAGEMGVRTEYSECVSM